jgi:hypothetical protein
MEFVPNETHYQQLVEGIRHATSAIEQADRAAQAGIDLSGIKAEAEATLDKLRRIRAVYYPGR